MDEHERSGWIAVSGGLLMNLMLGVTYSWSVFALPLAEKYGWTQTQVALAFSIMLAVNAFSMIPAGMFLDRHGPRGVARAGGLLLGLGFIATGLFASSPFLLYITYGVIVGIGVGVGYGAPLATAVRWFQKERGLATGVVVFGFGFGSFIIAPIATWLILSYGISETFIVLGVVFALVVLAASTLLTNPPGWGGVPKAQSTMQLRPSELLGKRQFWLLWLMLLFAGSAGLMVIGNLATFAKLSLATAHGAGAEGAFTLAALAVGVLAVFNGGGRILAGFLSDKIGRAGTMFFVFFLQALLLMTIVPASGISPLLLYVWAAAIGFCFGANFALFPSISADTFGTANMGADYGLLFTAYGIGGILGPQVMAHFLDAAGGARGFLLVSDYSLPFALAGILMLCAAALAVLMEKFSSPGPEAFRGKPGKRK